MKALQRSIFTMTALMALAAIAAAKTEHAQTPRKFLFMRYTPSNAIIEMDAAGTVTWEHPVPSLSVMFEIRKNGNIIYAYGGNPTGVQEVDRDHNIVWNYKADCEQVMGFSTLPNGNVLVGEQGPCRAVEVNKKGEIVRITPLTTSEKAAHRQLRSIHKLRNGNILACHEADATVREVTPAGKVVWEFDGCPNVFEAIRLKNGNTLIAAGTSERVIEVTPDKKIVWEFNSKDAPELNMTWMVGIHQLKNGNIIVANFMRGREGKGAHAFEVTRDKKVIWTFTDHKIAGLVTMVRPLDEK